VRARRLLQGALLTASLFSVMVPPAMAAVGGGGAVHAVSRIDQSAAATAAYWTPARMAAATPVTNRNDDTKALKAGPMGAHDGSKVVGALFHNNGSGDHFCSASVIYSSRHNLLLTAAHCLYYKHKWSSKIAFVPKYTAGHRPYGLWTVSTMTLDSRWINKGDVDLDFGFAGVNKLHGKNIADVVGYNSLLTGQGFNKSITVIGYPRTAGQPIHCETHTFKQSKYQQGFDCPGFTGGTSGSPWIMHYNKSTQSGMVIGALGGYQQGGATASRSYSAVFDNDIKKLKDRANSCTHAHCS
jgi:V8-like Glu-specific endopeptidase